MLSIKELSETRRRLFSLISIMAFVAFAASAASIWFLYDTAVREERLRLQETAQSQARLIEAVARFNNQYLAETFPGSAEEATLSQITDSHSRYKGFGETGEFTLARRQSDQIIFLLSHRHSDLEQPGSIPWASNLAAPMRAALLGQSGTLIGLDYRGATVLAAHEPVAELDLGIVAKIDLAEIRSPFINAGLLGIGAGILVLFLGVILFRSVAKPVVERDQAFDDLRQQAKILEGAKRGLANAQRLAHIGSWEWDVVTGQVEWSDECFQVFGQEPGQIETTYELIISLLDPEDAERLAVVFQNTIDTGKSYAEEHKVIRPDGTIAYVIERGEVSKRGPDGQVIRLRGTVQDITERKLADDAVKELNESLERQLELLSERQAVLTETQRLSHVGSWEWNVADGTVVWTDEAYRIWGVERGEFEPTFENIAAPIPPDEAELLAKVTRRAVETGESYEFEHSVLRPDGTVRHIMERGEVSAWDEHGQPTRVRGSMHDITEQKRTEEQLRQAQKMEAVGQLTGGVAHEFNNLLLVILGNLEVLESRLGKDDPLQSVTSTAMKGALRGAELTQSLLAFSRKQRLEAGETDLGKLVSATQNLFQRTLGETIIVETDLAEGLWLTSADTGQIEAALLNFILNARDAMPDGGTITVSAKNRVMTTDTAAHQDGVEPGEYVTLEVRDSGAGMTNEQIEHAFEPFYTTKEVGEGTGLGLSVAYGFAKQSGGCLEIESEPGQGTTIRLSLPRAVEKKTGTEVERSATEPLTGSGKILVLEDDADVRALAVSQLSDLGYEVIEAEDGPSALTLLDEHPDVDLLFSDVVLPGGMSGPEAAKRAHQEHAHLKVLFTSGYPEKDIEDMTVNGENVAILRKPYLKAGLAEAIAAAMKSG